ncbi:glyoxalase [Lichenihabitans sp. Uapishka_5]|uniref:VOC family protein n=1 Tax=Lichenihabitans sp. Uapishka_5 TaxID=3037302 RepID=UPI0029E82119|nr:glyoxalase [Lichenihabitans sp. Uapishka_5]MDX7951839.1 glyoxalase [Lichenihabitans sp. Uapishka_5]
MLIRTILLAATAVSLLTTVARAGDAQATPAVAVAPQYDTTHVYVAPDDVDRFVGSFIATFGGQTTKQVVADVTPTPSSTTSQLLQTPVGTVSLFGFKTPIPHPFGEERTGYLVTDMDEAVAAARAVGADVIVTPFPDPIGRDAVIQWPGGVNTQIYWHTTPPSYPAFLHVPDNRVYVSADRADAFIRSFAAFTHGTVTGDVRDAPGVEIGVPGATYRRVTLTSDFGRMRVAVTDGHLPYPYGRETTGYAVDDFAGTLAKARAAGVAILIEPIAADGGQSAMVEFPGGYVAEIHAATDKP